VRYDRDGATHASAFPRGGGDLLRRAAAATEDGSAVGAAATSDGSAVGAITPSCPPG